MSWLRANQNGDGGFGQFKGRDSNAQSTSYAIQGLLAAGAGGATSSRARGYLVRLQRSDGSVGYSSSSAQTPVWVTAQALMALNGKPLPTRGGAEEQADAREGGAADGSGGGASGARRRRQGRLQDGQGRRRRSRGWRGLRRSGRRRGGRRGRRDRRRRSRARPTRRARPRWRPASKSGAAHPKPVPVWAALVAALGLVALLWVLQRYVLPGRWPGLG